MKTYNLLKINSNPLPKSKQVVWDSSFGLIEHREAWITYDDNVDIYLYQSTRKGVHRPIWCYARLFNGLWYTTNQRPKTRTELVKTIIFLRGSRKQTVLKRIEAMKKVRYTLVETFAHLDWLFVNMKYTPDWLVRGAMLELQDTFDRDNLNMWYPFLLTTRNLNIRTVLVRKKKMLDYFCELFDKKFSLDKYKPSLNLEDWRDSVDDTTHIAKPITYEEFLDVLGDVSEGEMVDMLFRYGGELTDSQWKERKIPLKKQLYNKLYGKQ